ncbi:MAG: iron ABC transporter permease [Gemmatimonadetes bacterium]|nr:iron ABC transporter permease [Gemmatimonadota bacterium]
MRRGSLVPAWALLAAALVASACIGAFAFTPAEVAHHLAVALGLAPATDADALAHNVFVSLRLPRVLMSALSGAALAMSGALLQGLFRNPIVEPGLAGTSAGAALGAAVVFVFGAGSHTALSFAAPLGVLAVPLMAFIGALAATALVYRLASSYGAVSVLTLLLAGIAVNALGAAGTGFLSYIARDPQARNITFWTLGTYTTASWTGVLLVAGAVLAGGGWARLHAKGLNALMLGETEAAALGEDPTRLARGVLLASALMVAVATAMTGVIAFVGLVVPHVVRWWRGADHARVIGASAVVGALMMVTMDIIARLVIPPAELPIGIITAVIGAPLFLVLLRRMTPAAMDAPHA